MKNMSNIAKFFIACAIIFCIGLVMAVGGMAAGGVKGLEKIAEERDWISEGPGELTSDYIDIEDFDSIDINGDADVIVLSESYYGDDEWMEEHNDLDVKSILNDNGASSPEAGHVLVVRGDKLAAPDIKVEKGILNIQSEKMSPENGISVNFSSAPSQPVIYVFCGEGKLSEIKTDSFCGDIKIGGITLKNANLTSDSGDVAMYGVNDEAADISMKSGDVRLSGTFKGPTNVKSQSGDVDIKGKLLGKTSVDVSSGDVTIDTSQTIDKYKLNINALSGDLEISDGKGEKESYDENPVSVQRGEGPNTIKVDSKSGDIDLSFEMSEV